MTVVATLMLTAIVLYVLVQVDEAAHLALVPAAAMFFTVLSLNFVGDTMRRSLDVRDSNL